MTPFPQNTPAPRRRSFPKRGEVCADGAGGEPYRTESYPPLPDFEMSEVSPAADGRPWRKACPECLFRRHDPQGVEDSYQSIVRYSHPERDGLFYCTHRTDGGEHRICACYAACRAGEGVPMPAPRTGRASAVSAILSPQMRAVLASIVHPHPRPPRR